MFVNLGLVVMLTWSLDFGLCLPILCHIIIRSHRHISHGITHFLEEKKEKTGMITKGSYNSNWIVLLDVQQRRCCIHDGAGRPLGKKVWERALHFSFCQYHAEIDSCQGKREKEKNSFTHLDLAGHRSCHSHFWTSPRGELTIKHDNLTDLRILERLGEKLFQQIFFGANIRSTPNMPPFVFVRKPAVYDSVAIYQVLKLSAQEVT